MTLIVKSPSKNVGVFKFDGTKQYPENAVVIHNGILYVKTGEQSTVGIQTTTTTNLTISNGCSPCAKFRRNEKTTTKTYTTGIPVFLSPDKDLAWTPVSSDVKDYSDILRRIKDLETTDNEFRGIIKNLETKVKELEEKITKMQESQEEQDKKIKANSDALQKPCPNDDRIAQLEELLKAIQSQVNQNKINANKSLSNDEELANKLNSIVDLAGRQIL